jgi:hypothetical protein
MTALLSNRKQFFSLFYFARKNIGKINPHLLQMKDYRPISFMGKIKRSIFSDRNNIYPLPFRKLVFSLLRYVVFRLIQCLNSSLFASSLPFLLPFFYFSFLFLPFSLKSIPFSYFSLK